MDILLLALVSLGPALFCLIRGAMDFTHGRTLWGAAGLIIGLLALALTLLGSNLPPYAS